MVRSNLTCGMTSAQATPSRWDNLQRIYDAVGHNNVLFTIVGPTMVMLIA